MTAAEALVHDPLPGLLLERVARLEQRVLRQRRLLIVMSLLVVLIPTIDLGARAVATSGAAARAPGTHDSILVVRGLSVVDAHGTERVRIGAPLPNPPIFGRRVSRGEGEYAGIILMDATGTERSGYATTDAGQVMITLDETGRMVMNFMAQPSGGVRLNLTDAFDNAIRLGSSREGPFLQMTRGGRTVLALPDTGTQK